MTRVMRTIFRVTLVGMMDEVACGVHGESGQRDKISLMSWVWMAMDGWHTL